MILYPRCQQQLFIGEHTLAQVIHGRTYRGLGIVPAIRNVLRAKPAAKKKTPGFGEPSAYTIGDWVRVLDADPVRATLDARERTRGLRFSPQQYDFCGRVAQVTRVVRRIIDDDGTMRPVSKTVLLDGIHCDGIDGKRGCGRRCPLMFRDEWLERASAPIIEPRALQQQLYAKIRPADLIRAQLDWRGRRGGVLFTPEQGEYGGQRFRVIRKLDRVFEADRESVVREPIYVLDMPRCRGGSLGPNGHCDRGCSLLWHGDWLELELESPRPSRIVSLDQTSPMDRADFERAAAGAPAFAGPEFFRLTAKRDGRGAPLLVLASDASRAAALPLRREGRTLIGLASADTPRYDIVGDGSAVPALWSALREDDSWDVLELEDVPMASPLATTLLDLARADGFRVASKPGLRSPWFAFDDFESRLTAKFRANLRRCARNLGDATLERIEGFDLAAFDEGLAIEMASWKGTRGTAIGAHAEQRAFYASLLETLPKTRPLVLQFLRAHGRRIAFEIAAEDASTHFALKVAYHPDFAAYSPDHLLIERVAIDAQRRGLLRLDFMGWDQEWKRKWTDRYVEHVSSSVYRPNARGLFLYSAQAAVKPRLVRLKTVLEARVNGDQASP